MTWPSMESWWPGMRDEALGAFAELAAALSRFVPVRVNCAPGARAGAEALMNSARADMACIEFFPHETDDVWCRDSGAIFRFGEESLEAVDFRYNAWGGKFPPWDRDDALAAKMARAAGARNFRFDGFVCEGGALEFSGSGELLTTDCVILNPNRNRISPEAARAVLREALGVGEIVSLPGGLFNDDTDGHIDNLARFTPCGAVLASCCESGNPSFGALSENMAVLRDSRGAGGRRFDVVPLRLPDDAVIINSKAAPASYANYLVTNGLVLVPTFGQPRSDDRAMGTIADMFPGRAVRGIESRPFLAEGGAVHCLTQQEPLWKPETENPKKS